MTDATAQIAWKRQAAWILIWLGIVHIPLLGFHFAFPALFRWSEELPRLSDDNAGLLLCFHACGLFWLGSMGAATLVDGIRHLRSLDGFMHRGFWLWMAGFYLYRAAAEIPCFGITREGLAIMVPLLALAGFYLVAWKRLATTGAEAPEFVAADKRFDT